MQNYYKVVKMKSSIIGSGIYLPEGRKTNEELERELGLERGFIESSTGILERRWCQNNETLEHMASEASLKAVKNAGIDKVNRIIISRDVILTERARSIGLPIIQRLKGEGVKVDGCYSIDLVNYCPGAIHSVNIARLMVESGETESVLVVAPTRYVDMVDTNAEFNLALCKEFNPTSERIRQFSLRDTSKGNYQLPKLNGFLWGNGAGALVVEKSRKNGEFVAYDAQRSKLIPYDSYGIGEDFEGQGFASLDGTAIYKFAVREIPEFIEGFLKRQGITPEQITSFIPHQPNPRILKALAKKFPSLESKMEISCDKLGNMIGASIPITYHLAKEQGRIKSGDYVFMCSFGDSYLTASGLLFRED